MSLYVLMRILESAPDRYELAIRMLTLGRLDRAYEKLASHVRKGQRVLDLGCGTGALTLRTAQRGARVMGIDINARMLETAERRAREAGLADQILFRELGVAELEGEKAESYDAILSGLCFSELTDGELILALGQVKRLLKPGGLLLVADEVKPKSRLKRLIHALIRVPLVALTYLVTQQTTHPVENFSAKLEEAGLCIQSVRESPLGSFIELVARKPEGGPS